MISGKGDYRLVLGALPLSMDWEEVVRYESYQDELLGSEVMSLMQ